jgi:hypothetical protein
LKEKTSQTRFSVKFKGIHEHFSFPFKKPALANEKSVLSVPIQKYQTPQRDQKDS